MLLLDFALNYLGIASRIFSEFRVFADCARFAAASNFSVCAVVFRTFARDSMALKCRF